MAIAGDKLTKFVTAQWYNEVTASARHQSTGTGFTNIANNLYITLQNNTASDFDRWVGVRIGLPILDYTDAERLIHNDFVFELAALDSTEPHNIAVLQKPAPIGGSAKALVSGLTWLRLLYEPTERFIWVNSSNELDIHRIGRIEVLQHYYDAGSTFPYIALCLIGHLISHPIEYTFELTSDLVTQVATADIYSPNGTTNTLYESDVVIYDARDIFSALGTGDTGLCYWQDEKYYIHQANCPFTS